MDLSQITFGSNTYNLKDATARGDIENINNDISSLQDRATSLESRAALIESTHQSVAPYSNFPDVLGINYNGTCYMLQQYGYTSAGVPLYVSYLGGSTLHYYILVTSNNTIWDSHTGTTATAVAPTNSSGSSITYSSKVPFSL